VPELQARIREMQATKLDTRSVRTHPALAGLLPGGSLKSGAAYSVEGSMALLMALMAGPSADGVWCGVIGLPDFGVEAAARFGIDLERLVLVPHPGDDWLTVTAAMADVVGMVVTRAPRRATDASVARLQARIRQREATLVVLGDWPQSEASLRVGGSSWSGIGQGHGYLAGHEVTVSSSVRGEGMRPRQARLWLPDGDELFRAVEAEGTGRPLAPAAPGGLRSVPRMLDAGVLDAGVLDTDVHSAYPPGAGVPAPEVLSAGGRGADPLGVDPLGADPLGAGVLQGVAG
jgi:hypothetical protein